jgi:two-component system response regulator
MKAYRILLVEDNPDDELLTLRALKRVPAKLEITVARDGQEALDKLSESTGLPDLMLLDLKLPKLSGLEVLQRIRQNARTSHLLVVVLTSSDEPSDIKSSYKNYANSYIRKPVAFEEFGRVVSELGAYWLQTNLCPPAE